MNTENAPTTAPEFFVAIFQQNWENARHIKSERIWFMNIHSVVSAGALSLLPSFRSIPSHLTLELTLIFFLFLFSAIGLLTSLRLKAELEECLAKLQALVKQMNVSEFVALEQSEGDLARYPKFRWMFPIFYAMMIAGWLGLFVYLLAVRP